MARVFPTRVGVNRYQRRAAFRGRLVFPTRVGVNHQCVLMRLKVNIFPHTLENCSHLW